MKTRNLTQTPRMRAIRVGLALVVLAATFVAQIPAAGAQDLAEANVEGAQELAEKYAPIMMLKAQEAECDSKGEPYGPTSADILLDNDEIVLRQVGTGNPVITVGPSASDLFGLSEGFYLDFPGGALEPGCIYEKDFLKYSDDTNAVVYAHIVQQDGHPDQLALQYWFYWYYNDWNNKHEGDWEGIQLLFSASSIEEALNTEPTSVGFAQHEGGEVAEWDSSKLERDGSHPMVFSSAGSHASYFGAAVYLGRSGSEGFGCDNTDGPSDRVEPEVVVLPDSVTDPNSPLAWLAFNGRWGERQGGPFNGPTGPTAKGRWLEPVDWHEELRPSSVVIPAGDSFGASVISGFCGVVEWGSGTLISFTTSPAKVLIGFALVFFLISWLTRRTDWARVEPLPLRRRRSSGQIIRVAGTAYAIDTRSLIRFGLFYLPAGILGLILTSLIALAPVVKDLLGASGGSSGSDLVLSLVAGGIPNLIALVFVNAGVAVYLDRAVSDNPISAADAARMAWDKRAALGSGLLRATAVVGLLLITVIGTPLAIYQLVRYQFMPHAVMLEDLDGKAGLARSTEIVKGRWIHTTLFLLAFNGLVLAVSLGVGILLLVVFNQVPLVVFSGLMTLLAAFIAPLSAYALTLLYGDAIAQETGQAKADRPVVDPVAVEAIA